MRRGHGFGVWLFFSVLASSTVVQVARAEGSRDLDAADSGGALADDQALTQDTVLRVDILNAANEEICWRGNGNLRVYRPDGTTVVANALTNNTCVDAATGVSGAYLIDMLSSQNIGTRWDIRVCTKGQSANTCHTGNNGFPGRLWSYLWNFRENTNFGANYSINGSVYAIVPGGDVGRDAVIEMQMRGVSGAYYRLTANGIGPEESAAPNTRIGRSVAITNSQVTPSFPLYLNPPAKALYNWIAPIVSNVTLTPNCGGGVVQDRAPGSIKFTSNVTGQYVVICDVNKDGVYDFASQMDFSSFGAANPGVNTATWDGRNNAGANAAGGNYNCLVRLNVGEFHYDAEDIETAYPGIRMFRIESDKTTRTGIRMFWDDSDVPEPSDPLQGGQISPNAPPAAGLDPGAYGMNTSSAFFYMGGDPSLPQGNARAWGDFGGNNGKGNDVFLDQFAAADTAISPPFVVTVLASTADADSDGLTNARECDLGANPNDNDSDDDGVEDGDEATGSAAPNTDNDGPIDILDPDSDNDGVTDGEDVARRDKNVCRDTDGDRCDDCALTGANSSGGNPDDDGNDSDDDGLCNDGTTGDSGDGDPDDDNDGVPDENDVAPEDASKCRDVDQDGCDDCARTGADQSGGDPDDDGPDSDGNGRCELEGDSDSDGVPDDIDLDRDNDGIPNASEGEGDTDGDGIDNEYDLDSDGDGLPDIYEAGGDALDANHDGRIDSPVDTSPRDGLHDALQEEGTALPLPDTDLDGAPDFLDTDDDDDGLTTVDERPGGQDVDTDDDGAPDYLDADDDDDGLATRDELDADGNPRDSDDDGTPDHLDPDDDGDGVSTRDERTRDGRNRDSDGDEKPDHLDTDDDGDGIFTRDEPRDADRNGTPDRLERPRKGTLAGGALCAVREPGSAEHGAWGAALALCAVGWAARRTSRKRRRRGANHSRARRTTRSVCVVGLTGGVALLSWASQANAQVALDQFRPAPLWTDGFAVSRPVVLPHASIGAFLALDYANDPLVYERTPDDPDSEEVIVSDDMVLHAALAFGLCDIAVVFVGIPVHLMMEGDTSLTVPAPYADGAGLGDVSLGGRILILGDDASTLALAGELIARLPTAEWADDGQTYRGDAIGSYEPALIFEVRAGRFDVRTRAAARLRKEELVSNLELGQEFVYGVGARLQVTNPLWLHAEVHGSTFLAHAFEREVSPAEALLGGKLALGEWGLGLAGGPGLLRGYGSPDFRVVAMVGYTEQHVEPPSDLDHDGLLDAVDLCPRDAEDLDGWEDLDGCPDPDNDKDGILDGVDHCRNKPEDADKFEDEDGCPDPDNDKDGILDADDRCPLEPEDTDSFEDTDGCPEPDNDKDHILDANDSCPNEPEDYDGWEDGDGCPEPEAGLVKLTCEKIEIKDSVYFDSGSDRIQERSFTLLNQVAAVLQQATQIRQLRVDGHTDDRGKDASNLELSKRRAASVMRYLLERGIADNRLTSEGYGETRPITDNKTAAGRSQNRRVEFVVLESEGCP